MSHIYRCVVLGGSCLLGVLSLAWGVTPTPLPTGGVSVVSMRLPDTANVWSGNGDAGVVGTGEIVEVEGPGFDRAFRVNVVKPIGQYWNGAIQIPVRSALDSGDALLVRLFFRSIETTDESGNGFATVFVQGAGPNYEKYLNREIVALGEWTEFLMPFVMTNDVSLGDASLQIGFGAGAKSQVFEVGGIEMVNYSDSLELGELPITKASYQGRELDSGWRQEAEERIEQFRKGNLGIRVVAPNGDPAVGASVSVEFKKHAYHFGSVVSVPRIVGTGTDDQIYREKFLELFNQSGPENGLKWAAWEGEWGSAFSKENTLSMLQWLKDNNIYARGHVMVWPSKFNLPQLMQQYLPLNNPGGADPLAKQVVLDHIDDVAKATAGLIDEWDVLNEPYDNHYLMDAFGQSVMTDWFARARENLPGKDLYLNDYGILSAGGRDLAHQDHFAETIRYLLEGDAPLTGIGMQGHFSGSPTGIEKIYQILNRYHDEFPDLDIRITELDISTEDEILQAEYLRDFLTIVFSHPATVGVQKWGFWAGAHWRPIAALYDEDWRAKPAVAEWKQLIFEKWWNNFEGTCDMQGEFALRGFWGEYRVNVEFGGETYSFEYHHVKNGPNQITVDLAEVTDLQAINLGLEMEGDGFVLKAKSGVRGDWAIQQSNDLQTWKQIMEVLDSCPEIEYSTGLALEGCSTVFVRAVLDN